MAACHSEAGGKPLWFFVTSMLECQLLWVEVIIVEG